MISDVKLWSVGQMFGSAAASFMMFREVHGGAS